MADSTLADCAAAQSVRDSQLLPLLGRLTLEEKVQLLTGRDFWTTWPMASIGLRRMLFSDGPSGVRGEVWDERSPSLNLPSATALSSAWDREIAERYGAASAMEARRKGVDVVLGPTINLHRSPLGGRHFEAFSEDPVLTAELAVAYVNGVQRNGIGATPKHYVANDFETDRFTADVVVGERGLRELYLLAFEKAITESHAWLVMSAYNSINGATATENELLETPLNSEWGFDGVVISDWTAVRSIESARHSQDLAMPGPVGPWGEALVSAVRDGEVEELAIDRKVLRLLRLAARVGAIDGFEPELANPLPIPDGHAFAREAAAEGMVLVSNDGILPLDPRVARIAVIGHNALIARTQGGGSATVVPESVVSPLQGIRDAFPDAVIEYRIGAVVQEGISELAPTRITNPSTGRPGALVRFLDTAGREIYSEDRLATAFVYFGGNAPIAKLNVLEFSTRFLPEESGEILLGFAGVGSGRVFVDGQLVTEQTTIAVGTDLGAALLSPPAATVPVAVVAGIPLDIRVEYRPERSEGGLANAMALTVGIKTDGSDPQGLIMEAAEAATSADVAIVVVGTSAAVESEGHDRHDLALPGHQDDLVEAILAANPRTIVVVNSGSPVELPWRERVAAVLLSWFGGQEYGNALADVLSGLREPGGRLPTTWPGKLSDVPVADVTPLDGVLRYDEGIHIGYRAWLKSGATPAYPFGFGVGYTSWELGEPATPIRTAAGDFVLTVPATNTGSRAGKHVVQVYASRTDSAVDRPVRWLIGFSTIRADAGESVTAEVSIPTRLLAYWNDGWVYEPGEYTLHLGTSVNDLPYSATIKL